MGQRTSRQLIFAYLILIMVLSSCASAASTVSSEQVTGQVPSTGTETTLTAAEPSVEPTPSASMQGTSTPPTTQKATQAQEQNVDSTATKPSTRTPTADQPEPAVVKTLPPEQWKDWPVLPEAISDHLKQIYQDGLARGNNPNAFSILGDCQSQPEVFMGPFDNDQKLVKTLPLPLQETVRQFSGSFDRYSPTVKDGTTEGALLWIQWNDNKEKKCEYGETPLDCELRDHQPSIVFIHIGTHYEARNRKYLTTIIEKILEQGAVPVLVTKADNRELDERVNETLASLADEYQLPLWNFWASVQHLPDHGMEKGSDTYLSEEGILVHRMGALQMLDLVWRAVSKETSAGATN